MTPPETAARSTALPGALRQRLLIVTGKGGVGKTVVSTGLAAAAAARGERTLLVVMSETDVTHPLLGAPVGYAPSPVRPNLSVSRVDGHSALKEYVNRNVWLPGMYDWLIDGPALRHFTEAAPGFEELMCLGKLYELVTRSRGERFARVVFDAPASGHAALMLRVARATAQAVRTGPLHHNAVKIQMLLESDLSTAALLVAVPEELAVREALELRARLHEEALLHTGPVIMNRVRPSLFTDREIDSLQELQRDSRHPLLETAFTRHAISTAQRRHVSTLAAVEPRIVELPEMIRPLFDAGALIEETARLLAPLLAEPAP